MKQTKLLFLLLQALPVLLLLAMPTQSMAQGQDANHKWNGNPISSVVDNHNEDMGTVYLYNVGTGKFLNTGSYWGTIAVGFKVGMTVHISYSGSHYKMRGPLATTEGNLIAFGRRKDTPGYKREMNYNNVYVDRGVDYDNTKTPNPYCNVDHHINGIINWDFTEVKAGSNTYYISFDNDEDQGYKGKRCLQMKSNGKNKTNKIEFPKSENVGNSNRFCQWKIITKKDLKDAFKATYASDEAPADATFLVYDQNFERGNTSVGKWVADGVTWMFEKPKAYQFKPDSKDYTYYVGNGAVSSNYYMAEYAGYTTANVRNVGNDTHANGKVSQAVTTIKKGWYKVSCNGFYNAVHGSNMVSSLFARVQGDYSSISNVSAPLNRFNHEFSYTKEDLLRLYDEDNLPTGSNPRVSPYANAGIQFEKGKYNNTILVYVPKDNAVLNIGIEITGSTKDLDWTSWDNFQLQYCGNNDMVLDEGQTSLEYLEKQGISPINAYTLILKRTMKPGLWSSITLPVALTAGQFKTAFGDYAKLAHLKGQDANIPTRIDFESVDLTEDDDIVIYPEQLYIMQSTRAANVVTGNYEKLLTDHTKLTVAAPYFTINNVSLPKMPNEIFKETPKWTTTEAGNIQFCGTQINQTSPIVPAQSYVLGANNGKWYYTKTALPIKGFRCWIATNANGTSPAKPLTFAVDGKVEGDVTAIQGLEQDTRKPHTNAAVYNLHGQKVASDASNLNSLPAGIYIVNNKKILVK
ncbi:adhesin [Prevotella intermedia]|uniref:Adhesin n=1 Tax=Prevotella intermedia TaxID=28131 RepID=A0AAJ3RFM0_PREIN|nr:adhesin [Prevotella intermedia]PIK16833.1 adhesin [Prevotella intermedia]